MICTCLERDGLKDTFMADATGQIAVPTANSDRREKEIKYFLKNSNLHYLQSSQ